MSNNSKNSTAAADVPALHSFEFDKNAIGNIKSSVNKFRGCVSLPLDFMTLPGLEGLDVKLSALYSSNIKNSLNTWNLDAATGILGLGWQMPLEMIAANKAGSASASSDSYYLVSGGSANPMVKTGETSDGKWIFQLRNYEFWSIQYDPQKKQWTIVKENGFIYTYGAGTDTSSNATQWGISWGNWMGSSNQGSTQVQLPVAWNLASVVTPMGSSVQYQYENVNQQLISSTLAYTQASYLKKVIDSYGRTITFNYGNKFGILNPGTGPDGKPIIEYQPQHTQITPPSPNAYQDRYETYFLDSIDIQDPDGINLSGIKFTYDFLNNAATSDSNYSLMYKRCLKSIFQYAPNGETLPAMNFDYEPTNGTSPNPGALIAVTYPEGGRATFQYKKQTISSPSSSRKSDVRNPLPGSIPRVWFGSDYVVFTYLASNQIQLKVQSWNGQWVNQDIPINKTAVADSLSVATADNFFAVSFRNQSTNSDELYLFRNDNRGQDLQFGKWQLYNNQPFILTLTSQSKSKSVFVAGDSFVMAYNKDYTTTRVQGFSYTWQDGRWNTSPPLVPPSSDCQVAAITAMQNFYIVSCYLQSSRQLKNYVYYRLAEGTWKAGSNWSLSNIDVVVDSQSGTPYLSISPMPTSMALTFVTKSTNTVISYSLRLYNWDENFFIANGSSPAAVDLSSPIVNNQSLYEIFQTLIVGSTVNNNLALLRNAGGNQQMGSVWKQASFQAPGSSAINLATGDDCVFLSPASGSSNNQFATFNPNYGTWTTANGQLGTNPSIAGRYMTIGKNIYYQDTNGAWQNLQTQLNNCNYLQSIQNRAPKYIAYQDTNSNNASSYVVALKNGTAQLPQQLNGVKVYVEGSKAGTQLAAGRFLITYPSSATSFDVATSMSLWNLDEVNFDQYVIDTPVAYIVIQDDYTPENSYVQSFFYSNSAESQIVFNGLMGVAQYPLVTVVPGIKEMTIDPTSTPEGSSQFYYSNGLAQQSTLYPSGGIQNYQNILNGILLGQKDYDNGGKLISSQLDYWTVYTQDATFKNLFGGYAKCEKTLATTNGIVQWSKASYDRGTGMMLWQEKSYYDAEEKNKNNRTEYLYAFQVPEYAAAFNKLHIFSAVAMTTQSVAMTDGSSRNYIQSEATTYRNWANTQSVTINLIDGANRIAAYETYNWTTPGSNAPQFPSSGNAPWQLKTRIVSRTDKHYLIAEQVDVTGLVSSFIYDKNQYFLIAKFPNASIAGDEASYYGFESYETDQGWKLAAGGSIIPNNSNMAIDAHTGTNSLSIAAASTGIQRTFSPKRNQQQYMFSAWVKKPQGFNNANGNASWKIAVTGSGTIILNFPDAIGQWVYISQLIALPNTGNIQVAISCENQNTALNVLADNLRFTPLACPLEASNYNTHLFQPNAILGANGETSRNVFNSFQQAVLTTNAADRIATIQSSYLSRSGNQGSFSIIDPNSTLTVKGANGGSLTAFTHGNEWQSTWQPQASVWNVQGTLLTQTASNQAGWLAYADTTLSNNYSLDVQLSILETITRPLGIQLGTALTIQWNPQTASWQLLDASNNNVLPAVDVRAFQLPLATYQSQLTAGTISNELCQAFAAAGYLLSPQAKLTAGPVANSWSITNAGNNCIYALKADGANLAIYTMNTRWTLLVGTNSFSFWANGKQVFSYTAPAQIAALPKLFFGNKVAIAQIATAINPIADIAFDDSRGLTIQAQQYAVTQMITSQSIGDNMGRMAVKTKPAYITATQNRLFAYCAGFASMNWTTGSMTGLVSDAYPADNGYPFARQTFETSPQSRVLQESIPGDLFRVNGGKCTSYAYTSVTGKSGDPVFSKKTTTNANGNVFYEVSTLLEQVIQHVSVSGTEIRNETYFDDAGNPVTIKNPNYFNIPANSNANDWVTGQTFDYANRVTTLVQGTKTLSKFIYDKAGNVRFSQDAQGAVAGTFNYTKYDLLSRPIESGYYTGTWNDQQLQGYADSNPLWPTDTPTWRLKNQYDQGKDAANAIGRIAAMQANNGNTGTADVTENLSYDLLGNTIMDTVNVPGFDSDPKVVAYEYNDAGTITRISYPFNAYAYDVFYEINALNQIVKITDKESAHMFGPNGESTIGTFSYDASGNPLENNLILQNSQAVKQSYNYSPSNWLNSINNVNSGGTSLLQEKLTYTEGGYSGAGYFDGTIASASLQVSGASAADQSQYAYDAMGQILHDHNPLNGPNSAPFNYDANGNILALPNDAASFNYQYAAGTQQVSSVSETSNSKQIASFSYDSNGNVKQLISSDSAITKAYNLGITYSPANMLPTNVVDSNTNGATLSLAYGCRNERVLKTVTGGTATAGKKLYIRGTNAMPLQELFMAAGSLDSQVVNYVYGPGGLIAIKRFYNNNLALFHVLKDHLGSTTGLMDLQGQIVASYQYTAFGALSIVSEPSADFMSYLFTGQEYDAEIGLYNYKARFYYAAIGRFIAIDPARQYFSPYLYASNNPVLYIDPSGMFSIKSFFSALAGIVIGAVEILIGVVIDVVAAAVAVFTGGLGTGATIAIGALSGLFYGAGISSITYSVFHFDDFSWRDYGIDMGIGALTGIASGGFGAAVGIAAKSAQVAFTEVAASARVASTAMQNVGRTAAATAARAGAWVAETGSSLAGLATNGPVTAGWQGLVKGIGVGVVKSEVISNSINIAKNLANGNDWDKGMGQVIFSAALSGSIGGLQVSNRIRYGTQ